MHFEPQAVNPKSWRTWFVEGLQLSARKPVAFAALALLFAGVDYLPDPLDDFMLLLPPLFLGLGCRLAHCADHARPSLEVLTAFPRPIVARLLLVGAFPIVVLMAFGAVLMLLGGGNSGSEFIPPDASILAPVVFEGGIGVLVVTWLWLLLGGFFLWFLLPLLAVPGPPLSEAIDQMGQAQSKNGFVLRVALSLSGTAFMFLLLRTPILAVPLIPLLSCMMYVSYRHIWLDRLQNEPKPIKRSATETASPVPLNYPRTGL